MLEPFLDFSMVVFENCLLGRSRNLAQKSLAILAEISGYMIIEAFILSCGTPQMTLKNFVNIFTIAGLELVNFTELLFFKLPCEA
ncbi:MAG: hypothetical protein ABH875_04460 [Candidatus Omnitrophota bacterium]